MGVHCDHFSANLGLRLDSPMFWTVGTLTPNHGDLLPAVFFSSSTWKRGGVWMHNVGEELNANNDK